MNQVWLLFKFMELFSGSGCLYVHIVGSLETEPLPHILAFCGVFGCFILISIMRMIKLLLGGRTLLHPSLMISMGGTLTHFICAMISMHYAERDFHLPYMDDVEERNHAHFKYCRMQSILAVVTGCLYLLQCILLLDLIVKTPPNEDLRPMLVVTKGHLYEEHIQALTNEEGDELARKVASIYFLGKTVDYWLRVKSQWFRQLAGAQDLNMVFEELSESSKNTGSDSSDLDSMSVSLVNIPYELAEKTENPFENVQSIRDVADPSAELEENNSTDSIIEKKLAAQKAAAQLYVEGSQAEMKQEGKSVGSKIVLSSTSQIDEPAANRDNNADKGKEDAADDKDEVKAEAKVADDEAKAKGKDKSGGKPAEKANKKPDVKPRDKSDGEADDKKDTQ